MIIKTKNRNSFQLDKSRIAWCHCVHGKFHTTTSQNAHQVHIQRKEKKQKYGTIISRSAEAKNSLQKVLYNYTNNL